MIASIMCKSKSKLKRGIERVQALADISRPALCCHSNETRAAIVNPPYSAQIEGIPYHSPNLHPGPCNSVGMRRAADRQTDTHRERGGEREKEREKRAGERRQ